MPKDNTPFPPGALVAGYFRDSGGDEQDLSVERQIGEFRRWLEASGLHEGELFLDRARPGFTTVGRDDFERMLRHFRSGAAREAGLAIWRSNRFGRKVDDNQFYRADLRRRGYAVYSLTDKIPQDRYGKLIEFVLDWKDEDFEITLSEDVASGLRHIVQTYGALPGSPPHGFLREPVTVGRRRDGRAHVLHRWVPDETLQPLVRRAFEMLVRGERLSRIHLATGLYSSKNSYPTFFRNPLYKGELHFGDLVVPNYCPPMVEPELWDLAQRILEARSNRMRKLLQDAKDPRRTSSPWLLSGLIFCARCESPLNGDVFNGSSYYRCSRSARWHNCDAPRVRAGELERAVLERLRDKLADPAALAAAQSEQYRLYRAAVSGLPDRRKDLAVRLGNLRREINNLVAALKTGAYSPAVMSELTALEVQEYDLRQEQEQIERLLANPPRPITPERMQRLAEGLEEHLRSAEPAERHRALAGWVVRVDAERQGDAIRARIAFRLPPAEDKKKSRLSQPAGNHRVSD